MAADADLFIKNIEKASGLGFEVIEMFAAPFYDMSKSDMDRMKEASKKYNMEFAYSYCFTPDKDISSGDASKRKKGIDYMTQILKNISYVSDAPGIGGITNGVWHGIIEDTKQDHWDRSVESVKEIIKVAEENNITYLLETVNRFENFMLNTHAESLKYAKDVGSPNIKVHLDTFHMNIEEDDMETAIVETGDMLGYFHLGENNRKPPGTGNMNWDGVFSALAKINYQGWITMEPFVLYGEELCKDIGLYRDLMPGADLDAEAIKALNFTKEMLKKYA